MNFFLIAPTETLLVLGNEKYISVPRHRGSMLAGYARFYAPIASIGALFASEKLPGIAHIGAATLFVLWIASFQMGRLSSDEKERRRAFRAVTGYAADPSLLVHGNPTLAAHLHRELLARAERLAPEGYRDALSDWRTIATRNEAIDREFLAIALTLARIERRDEAEIWERLRPNVAELPTSIAPLTSAPSIARAEVAAPQTPMWSGPVEVLPTVRGSFVESGFDVTVPARAYVPPAVCASCLGAAHVTRGANGVLIPYCASCNAHASRQATTSVVAPALTLALGGAAGALALVPGPSAAVSVSLAAIASALFAAAIAFLLPPRRAAAPATVALDAARRVGSDGDTITVFCKNEEWSQKLAEHYAGTRAAAKRINTRSLQVPALAVVGAAAVAGVGWHFNNPAIRVDNGTGAAVSVWVDGRVAVVVPPTTGTKLESLRVPRGTHKIGWSPAGAAAPTSETLGTFGFGGGEYLLDPDAHHCYWVDAMVYGNATPSASYQGAQSVALLHNFTFVNEWFEKSPDQADKGTVHYSLSRATACEELRACPAGTREAYWNCLVGATDQGFERCKEAARTACGKDDDE